MVIIFFTDIHGNQFALHNFLEQISTINYDLLVFGGDVFGYYYGQNEIINSLRERNVRCLLGNHDKMFLDLLDGKIRERELITKYGDSYKNIENRISKDNIVFLRSLKSELSFKAGVLNIYFAHGSRSNPLNGRIYPDYNILDSDEFDGYDFAFLGHTHHYMDKKIGNCRVINPGSIGQQRDGLGCKYLVFDSSKKEISLKKIQFDIQSLVDEINMREHDEEMKNRLISVLYRTKKEGE